MGLNCQRLLALCNFTLVLFRRHLDSAVVLPVVLLLRFMRLLHGSVSRTLLPCVLRR